MDLVYKNSRSTKELCRFDELEDEIPVAGTFDIYLCEPLVKRDNMRHGRSLLDDHLTSFEENTLPGTVNQFQFRLAEEVEKLRFHGAIAATALQIVKHFLKFSCKHTA